MSEPSSTSLVQATSLGGGGPDLLMLHGFGADRMGWIGTAPALLPVVQCWVLDLPGHGESENVTPAATLTGLAQQIDIATLVNAGRPLHLMGHSMGGALSMLLAARYPSAIASLTLIAPLGLGRGVNQTFIERYPQVRDRASMYSVLETLVFDSALITDALVDWTLEQRNNDAARAALAAVGHTVSNDSADLDAAIELVVETDIPRLVVWGQEDRINPVHASDEERFGGQWLHVAQCGHLPHVEFRKSVCATMTAFLSKQID